MAAPNPSHKGTDGRGRDVLTAEDCTAYERRALVELGQSGLLRVAARAEID